MKHHIEIKVQYIHTTNILSNNHKRTYLTLHIDLRARRILGPANVPQITLSTASLSNSITTIVLTTLAAVVGEPPDGNFSPVCLAMKEGTNSAVDFLRYMTSLFASQTIIKDDIVIIDNAKIHSASAVMPVLCLMASAAGTHVRFQPNYSPEVNSAELVHAFCKETIREYRTSESLWECIVASHACVTQEMMIKFYMKCVK
jgi:transposase